MLTVDREFQFWDGRATSLEEQALGPIHNPVEMGETLENVVRKLNAVDGDRAQFNAVVGTDATTKVSPGARCRPSNVRSCRSSVRRVVVARLSS
jgi:cytochrome c peroxidase